MNSALGPLFLIIALAIVTEGIIEYFGVPLPSKWKPYAAALIGILLCLNYQADLLSLLGFTGRWADAGSLLTGILIGRGSNYVNTLIGRLGLIKLPVAPIGALDDAHTAESLHGVRVVDLPRRDRGPREV